MRHNLLTYVMQKAPIALPRLLSRGIVKTLSTGL